jgi:hypothetical protein
MVKKWRIFLFKNCLVEERISEMVHSCLNRSHNTLGRREQAQVQRCEIFELWDSMHDKAGHSMWMQQAVGFSDRRRRMLPNSNAGVIVLHGSAGLQHPPCGLQFPVHPVSGPDNSHTSHSGNPSASQVLALHFACQFVQKPVTVAVELRHIPMNRHFTPPRVAVVVCVCMGSRDLSLS